MKHSHVLSFLLFVGALLGGAQAYAQSGKSSVIELYTSQNCSKCPSANQKFADFAKSHDVIALTFPVGYWDYLGWKDTFAQTAFDDRQRAYNQSLGRRGPYTPQIIFNGAEHCSAAHETTINKTYKSIRKKFGDDVELTFDGETIRLAGEARAPMDVWVAAYEPGDSFASPKSGVNKARTMVYHNRVTDLAHIGQWSGKGVTEAITDLCAKACAIIVQGLDHGPVVAALSFEHSTS